MQTRIPLRLFVLAAAIAALTFACGDDSDSDATAGGASSAATGPGGGGGGGGEGGGAGFLPLFCADACTKEEQCRADQFSADYGSLPECISACETDNAALADESLQCQSAITAQAGCYNALSCDAFNAAGEDGAEACDDVDMAVEAACADLLGSGLPGMSGSGFPGMSGSGLPGMSGSGLPGMSGSGLPGMSGSGLPGFTDSGLPGMSDSSSEGPSSAALFETANEDSCTHFCEKLATCDELDPSGLPTCIQECLTGTMPPSGDVDLRVCASSLNDLVACEDTISCSEFLAFYDGTGEFDLNLFPTCADEFVDMIEDCT